MPLSLYSVGSTLFRKNRFDDMKFDNALSKGKSKYFSRFLNVLNADSKSFNDKIRKYTYNKNKINLLIESGQQINLHR